MYNMELPRGSVSAGRKVVIDTDPGTDDLFALQLALLYASRCRLAVVGLVGTIGNTTVDNIMDTLRRFVSACWPAPRPLVMRGCEGTRLRNGSATGAVHLAPGTYFGADGIGNQRERTLCIAPVSPVPNGAGDAPGESAKDGIAQLIELSIAYEGELELVILGPCTSIAAAIDRDPRFLARIAKVTMMGGTYKQAGNVGPVQEFNVAADPEAAKLLMTRHLEMYEEYATEMLAQLENRNLDHHAVDRKLDEKRLYVLPWEVCVDQAVSFDWYFSTLMKTDSGPAQMQAKTETETEAETEAAERKRRAKEFLRIVNEPTTANLVLEHLAALQDALLRKECGDASAARDEKTLKDHGYVICDPMAVMVHAGRDVDSRSPSAKSSASSRCAVQNSKVCRMDVEVDGSLTRGMTVAYFGNMEPLHRRHVRLVTRVDVEQLQQDMVDMFE
eukprot:ANDGO_04565.mRNA.1 putative uridine nucleosidase 1